MLESGIPSRFTVRYLWAGYLTSSDKQSAWMAYIPRALAICYKRDISPRYSKGEGHMDVRDS